MRLFHCVALCSLACVAALTNAASAIVEAVDRGIAFLLSVFEPEQPPGPVFAGPALQLHATGVALPGALQQSLRHEAMSARIGVPRHI